MKKSLEIIWIKKEVVLNLHKLLMNEFGGAMGMRSEALLDSALERAQNLHFYKKEKSLLKLATAYVYGIIKDHAFVDGNKRLALVIGELFLKLNGITINASETEKYEIIMKLASSKITEAEFATWLENKTAC